MYNDRLVPAQLTICMMSDVTKPMVGVIMGSQSDWDTMSHCIEVLKSLGIAHEARVLSAHRTPAQTTEYCATADDRGLEVIIAAAGGAAHLAGVAAAHTTLPVLGVPMQSQALNGIDSLLSTVQMPAGIPVATLAIGKPGARNAALFAGAILANKYPDVQEAIEMFRREQTQKILAQPDPRG